jgi:hypothetical protein
MYFWGNSHGQAAIRGEDAVDQLDGLRGRLKHSRGFVIPPQRFRAYGSGCSGMSRVICGGQSDRGDGKGHWGMDVKGLCLRQSAPFAEIARGALAAAKHENEGAGNCRGACRALQ